MDLETPTMDEVLDPSDTDFFFVDFATKLFPGEFISGSGIEVEVDAPSAAVGVHILGGGQAPTTDGKKIQIWIAVAPEFRAAPIFLTGHTVLLTVTFATQDLFPRTIQRSVKVIFRQR